MKISWVCLFLAFLYWPPSQQHLPTTRRSSPKTAKRHLRVSTSAAQTILRTAAQGTKTTAHSVAPAGKTTPGTAAPPVKMNPNHEPPAETTAVFDESPTSTPLTVESPTSTPQLQESTASAPLQETPTTSTSIPEESTPATLLLEELHDWTQRPPFQGMVCGNTIRNIGGNRIIGGEEAIPHSWPWQILIICAVRNTTLIPYCGGNLISNKWVLTAAHCLISTQFDLNVISDCSVRLGKHYFGEGWRDRSEVSARIAGYYVHPQYDAQRVVRGYDIALLRLAGSVKLSERIKPICLPFGQPELQQGSTCYTVGWGVTYSRSKKQSDVLKQLEMEVQDVGYCQFTTATIGPIICAGKLDAWRDICVGDSGGPFSCRGNDGRWYLHGITSMVEGNCRGVASFTKVNAFQDWITQTISNNPWK